MSGKEQFQNVTLKAAANVYFDGKCVSHTFHLADGTRKSAGVILPSTLTFTTAAPEIMECVGGRCRVRIGGESGWHAVEAGQSFSVPADSAFDIEVTGEPFHYICHFG